MIDPGKNAINDLVDKCVQRFQAGKNMLWMRFMIIWCSLACGDSQDIWQIYRFQMKRLP